MDSIDAWITLSRWESGGPEICFPNAVALTARSKRSRLCNLRAAEAISICAFVGGLNEPGYTPIRSDTRSTLEGLSLRNGVALNIGNRRNIDVRPEQAIV